MKRRKGVEVDIPPWILVPSYIIALGLLGWLVLGWRSTATEKPIPEGASRVRVTEPFVSVLLEENEELVRENRILRMENEALKKTSAK